MAKEKPNPEKLLPLTSSVFHILLALSDGDLHGYGIMQEVAEHTGGQIRLGPGTLYGAIKRLLGNGLIVETDQRPDPEMDDERRRYYRLTDFGQQVLKAEVQRISKLVSVAQTNLSFYVAFETTISTHAPRVPARIPARVRIGHDSTFP
jgi:DNA-binding PadR family transcriptional regulator